MELSKERKDILISNLKEEYKKEENKENVLKTIDEIIKDRKNKIEQNKYKLYNLNSIFFNITIIFLTSLSILVTVSNMFDNELNNLKLSFKIIISLVIIIFLITIIIIFFWLYKKRSKNINNKIKDQNEFIEKLVGIFLKENS